MNDTSKRPIIHGDPQAAIDKLLKKDPADPRKNATVRIAHGF